MSEKQILVEQLSFLKKMPIFHEGDPGGCMFSIDSGSVAIVVNYRTPREKLLKVLHAGEFFGEMGMVRGLPRSASAVAMETETVVNVITWETLSAYFAAYPAKIVGIMQQLAQRVEDLSDKYIEACGAVDELIAENREINKQRSAVETENSILRKALDKASAGPQTPECQQVNGETQKSEDQRFQKYLEDYRAFMKTRK